MQLLPSRRVQLLRSLRGAFGQTLNMFPRDHSWAAASVVVSTVDAQCCDVLERNS